mgnify:FL=1
MRGIQDDGTPDGIVMDGFAGSPSPPHTARFKRKIEERQAMRSLTAHFNGKVTVLGGIAALAVSPVLLADDGGDDLFSAFTIPGLPYADTGDTSTKTNFDDVACPFTDSTSPDSWYRFEPAENVIVRVELCGSGYDTKTYVYNGSLEVVACNDDGGCGAEEPTRPA